MAEDFYKTLNVSRNASAEEIAKSHRKLARKHHPDLNQDDKSAKKRFQEIQAAYDCLNDPEKRKLYDQYGENYEQVKAAQEANPFSGRRSSGKGNSFDGANPLDGQAPFSFGDGVDISDLFRQFTGGSGGGASRGTRSGGRPPARGTDMEAEITVPLATAVLGGETEITLDRGGVTESLRVKIPSGVREGRKIRLRGQGHSSGGSAGDLLLLIHVAPHPSFKLSGQDLELKLPISLHEAAAGAKVEVPTPGGTITMTIPPGSQSGKRLRIKGQGVRGTGSTAGDLYVELQIKLPDRIGPSDLDELKKLEENYQTPLRKDIRW